MRMIQADLMSKTVWLVIGLFASIQPTLHAQREMIDRVLAVVGGEVITQSDADGAIALGLVRTADAKDERAQGKPFDSAQGRQDQRSAALDRLIERVLMLNEVRRYVPPEPGEAAIEQQLQTIRQRFSSPAAFAQALAMFGTDEVRLHEFVRDDLRLQAYLDERFASPEVERRTTLIADWLAGLRRRADVTMLYQPGK